MDSPASNRIQTARLDPDLDKPIYRIIPLWFFEGSLRQHNLILVPPTGWEDPFEDICANTMITDRTCKPWRQEALGPHLPRTYAQCWSYECHSDTLLRAYSRVSRDPVTGRNLDPRNEGVRVKTTPTLLLQAMATWANARPFVHFYLGRVIYMPERDVQQQIANLIAKHGVAAMATPDRRAETLWPKRDYYHHEDEVRLICIWSGHAVLNDTMPLPFDPNEVFLEVEFDPRLKLFENRERQERARSLGYTGTFVESPLYVKTLFDLVLDGGLKTPAAEKTV